MIDALLSWLQDTFWFVRKDAYPDFDKIIRQANEFVDDPDAIFPPELPVRRNWMDKVLTGKDDRNERA